MLASASPPASNDGCRCSSLRRLEITGFKSFADHTDLIFTGEGITSIVGPNGCGKSNVADAIAWVLGEQRVKHLRGGEMKDVIFQGSRNRSPSGMAEVVMHLVRDEVVEAEPDIEDIDSTLEKLDEQSVAPFDVSEPGAIATGSSDSVEDSGAPASEGSVADAAAANEPIDPVATAPGSDTPVANPKTTHHRHWRQRRNLALEFAPGESVSVTRRHLSIRRERIPAQRSALPSTRHSGSLLRDGAGWWSLRDHRTRPHRSDTFS